MFKQITILAALCGLCLSTACDSQDEGPSDGPAAGGGKADEASTGESALLCPDDDYGVRPTGREISTRAGTTNLVFLQCTADAADDFGMIGQGVNVENECCIERGIFDTYTDLTSCPQHSVIRTVDGDAGLARCVDDETGQFVNNACCGEVCDADAAFDSDGACRASNGQFEDTLCCHLNTAEAVNACDWLTFDSPNAVGRQTACAGDDGLFVSDSCCHRACREGSIGQDACADAAEDILTAEPGDVCPNDSTPNAGNICHNPANGQFVPAHCCSDRGLDVDQERSDECSRLTAQEAAGEQGDACRGE